MGNVSFKVLGKVLEFFVQKMGTNPWAYLL